MWEIGFIVYMILFVISTQHCCVAKCHFPSIHHQETFQVTENKADTVVSVSKLMVANVAAGSYTWTSWVNRLRYLTRKVLTLNSSYL